MLHRCLLGTNLGKSITLSTKHTSIVLQMLHAYIHIYIHILLLHDIALICLLRKNVVNNIQYSYTDRDHWNASTHETMNLTDQKEHVVLLLSCGNPCLCYMWCCNMFSPLGYPIGGFVTHHPITLVSTPWQLSSLWWIPASCFCCGVSEVSAEHSTRLSQHGSHWS